MKHGGDIYSNSVDMDFSINLNPLGPHPSILKAAEESLSSVSCYPDLYQRDVRKMIADTTGVESCNVYAGSGASELIIAVVRAMNPSKALLFEPAFSGYKHALDSVGCEIVHHALKEENGFAMTKEDLQAITPDIDLVFVCDPANPTGLNIDEEILRQLLSKAESYHIAVILDESFFLMSDKAYPLKNDRPADLLKSNDRLFLIRSLTKILAVPGIRTGYVLASSDSIAKLIRQLPEWNLSAPGEAVMKCGVRLLSESSFPAETMQTIRRERDYLLSCFRGMGLNAITGHTSFILFEGPDDLYRKLLVKRILIRECSDFFGLGRGWYRAAVKTHAENVELVRAIQEIM